MIKDRTCFCAFLRNATRADFHKYFGSNIYENTVDFSFKYAKILVTDCSVEAALYEPLGKHRHLGRRLCHIALKPRMAKPGTA